MAKRLEPGLAGMGLGWMIWDWNGTRVLGHDGSGVGCFAALRLVPALDTAIVVLTNYTLGGVPLADEILRGVLEYEIGLTPPPQAERLEAGAPVQATRYAGRYERLNVGFEVVERPGSGLAARVATESIGVVVPEDVTERTLDPSGDDLFLMRHELLPTDVAVRFLDAGGAGHPDYVYEGKWAHRKI